jgi:hypothetical protein
MSRQTAYHSLLVVQPTLNDRVVGIRNTLSAHCHEMNIINQNMHAIAPNAEEVKIYSDCCIQFERTLHEQLVILDRWKKASAVTHF